MYSTPLYPNPLMYKLRLYTSIDGRELVIDGKDTRVGKVVAEMKSLLADHLQKYHAVSDADVDAVVETLFVW